ncbi:ABC transporter ATP-binding protein [Allostella humosa]|uniref:ABC transporter ATP-binding protein n=1 Tax=Stella humosa TaxID=94 RepID=UPI0018D77EA4|nr:ABC transporter ATP-binding protein [Stella humosa]
MFRGLRQVYGTTVALEDFSLEVAAGEFLTLLGPSGSGKTTALNALAGFIEMSSGHIAIGGVSISDLPTEKRNIGMVFQNYSLFPHLDVLDNIAFPLRMRGVARRQARTTAQQALDLVRLAEYGRRMPHQLSGGQKQRVAFARAIVFEPRVLLMDEPLGALDLKLREAMQLEIKQFQRQIGCTVIYVTHDQGEALTLSDRIVVMDKGRVLQVGTPKEIYDAPTTRFVAEFIGVNNVVAVGRDAGGATMLEGIGPVAAAAPADARFAALRPEILRAVPGGNGPVMGTITDVIFLGDVVRYAARCDAGASLLFAQRREPGGGAHAIGARVAFTIEPGDIVFLAA